MPGAFKNDNMDLDESPPFTIDLGLYVDPVIGNELFPKPSSTVLKAENSVSPFDDSSRVSSYTNVNYDNVMFANNQDQFNEAANENYHKGSIDSHFHNEMINHNTAHRGNRNHSLSNASLSVNNLYNELSPLTTTTSLTPSVGSVHSTQPSFFSANQYITRNSLEQPPSSIHRPSFDYYSKTRASIDSQHSSQHQRSTGSTGRYTSFTNSITNMLPFMGDRSQRSPLSGPPSPQHQTIGGQPQQASQPQAQSQPQQQSRHLIRSIFKSSINNANPNNANEFELEGDAGLNLTNPETARPVLISEDNYGNGDHDILMSPTKEGSDFDLPDSNTPIKKAKRSKRSLFTRFKAPGKVEAAVEEVDNSQASDEANSFLQKSSLENESLDNSLAGNISVHNSSASLTQSSVNGQNGLYSTSLATSHGNNGQPEPDYAALFENVGKRKHIVSSSSYRKPKIKVKTEPDVNEKHSLLGLGGKSKIKNDPDGMIDNASFSDAKSDSISSGTSLHERSISHDSGENLLNGSSSSAIATASKRILGSKLYQKKKSTQMNMPAATMISKGVEVEVDLESLDLPPDTQIFASNTINSKTRTRGRKENKEADLLDLSKIYLCNYCSRRFKRQEHLKRHFRSLHTLEKPYDCPICQKKFSRSDNLNQHLKTHKQEEEMENMDSRSTKKIQ
ncbi:uncharacterized protein CANTADRAFT_89814 [Suhomyces tanzawaensis NRRL Y-17324]|uniref:C2H2-type domain-containing protein n=1 Tax=Suhomyces tanzawaensis NRRL Y-17324 TaxID=984487 RepID=A0A1E4SLH6_9ASCO|nr:uncharacterized protein CANTADRAFT_89814 [Suhomyces tanzawaensis NRRL Y-17324]ODV80242.1 hypothetical protein CANTADRAFT_89814 [Suhomyces tanzawaensis NRRL Y-17324]